MNKSKTIPIGLFLVSAFFVEAQYNFHNPVNIMPSDGLAHLWVYDFEEDPYGFIWIGTFGGLCRFDGVNVLQADPSFPVKRIRSLLRTGDTLWVSGHEGVAILNIQNGQFSSFPIPPVSESYPEDMKDSSLVRALYQDRQGYIWMAPSYSGFLRVDPRSLDIDIFSLGISQAIPAVHNFLDQLSLVQITQDTQHDSIYWGASYADLVRLNVETGDIRRFRHENEDKELAFNINRSLCMYMHSDGNIYRGSWNRGLSVFHPASGTFFIPSLEKNDQLRPSLSIENLYDIFPKNEKELFLSYSSGVYLYNIEDESVKCLKKNTFNPYTNQTYGVSFADSEGRLWNRAGYKGVQLFDPLTNQHDFYSVSELNRSEIPFLPRSAVENFYPGYITVAGQYSDGIYHINPSNGHIFKTPAPSWHLSRQKFFQSWGLAQIDKDELVVSENRNLFLHKRGEKELSLLPVQPAHQYATLSNIAIDQERQLWVGSTRDGLWRIDLNSKKIQDLSSSFGKPGVSGIFNDSKGNTWARFQQGHAVLPAGEKDLRTFHYDRDPHLTFQSAEKFCECPNGEIWLASNNEGIGLLSGDYPERGVLKKMVLEDSLGTYRAFRVACDRYNNLWIQGNNELIKLDRGSWKMTKYGFRYGLKAVTELFQFLENGKLLVGGRNGIYIVHPDRLAINEHAPKPYVITVKTSKGNKGRLEDYLNQKPLQLPYKENALTIDFAAINFTLPEAMQFRYRLKGVDEDWVDPGKNRSVTYSNLSGGNYSFQLKAANNEGIWSASIYELAIRVASPWYKSPWFFCALGLSMAGLVYGIYKYRINQIRKEGILKSEFERKIANVEMSALRSQMNPHFIFNCLNSIERYIIKNDTKKASEYLNSFGRLIRLILQNSRTDYVNLKDELEALELYLKLEQMRFRHSFDYQIIVPNDLNPENYEIPPMLIQPYIENAIWHGINHMKKNGTVKISITKNQDLLVCRVEDNGIGRIAAQTIKDSKKVKRTSMGMHITTERIEIINKLYRTNNYVEVIDLYDDTGRPAGTRVILNIQL